MCKGKGGGALTDLTYGFGPRRKKNIRIGLKDFEIFEKKTYGLALTDLKFWVSGEKRRAISPKNVIISKIFSRFVKDKKSFLRDFIYFYKPHKLRKIIL